MAAPTMKVARFQNYGPPETLVLADVDRPVPGDGQLLVKVHATGVHPFDTKLRRGLMQEFMPLSLPHTPGIDFAGVVESVGPGVTDFATGDAVFGKASGAYAEFVVASIDAVALKPGRLTFEDSATLPVGAGTAWTALFEAADVQPGQHVLVHGGAGGVGMYAVQLARWKGAHVIATTSATNIDFVKGLGAESVIDYGATRFEDVVRDMDAVIDTVGGDVLDKSWAVLKPGGILVTIAGRPSEEIAREHGVRATSIQGHADAARLRQIAKLVDDGSVTVEVAKVFPLADAAKAHALSETGHGRGRIVLRVPG